MDISDLLAQTADLEIPNADLHILSSKNEHFIVFESHILDFLVTFQGCNRFDDIGGQNWS